MERGRERGCKYRDVVLDGDLDRCCLWVEMWIEVWLSIEMW